VVSVPHYQPLRHCKTQNLGSGQHSFLLRCRDTLGRWGNPDTIVVNVNYFPYFVSVSYVDGQGVEQPLWIPKSAGERPDTRVRDHRQERGTGPIPTSMCGSWPSTPRSPQQGPARYQHRRRRGTQPRRGVPARLNGAPAGFEVAVPRDGPGERLYSVSQAGGTDVIRPGVNLLEISARDVSGRTTNMSVVFRVTLEQ